MCIGDTDVTYTCNTRKEATALARELRVIHVDYKVIVHPPLYAGGTWYITLQ